MDQYLVVKIYISKTTAENVYGPFETYEDAEVHLNKLWEEDAQDGNPIYSFGILQLEKPNI